MLRRLSPTAVLAALFLATACAGGGGGSSSGGGSATAASGSAASMLLSAQPTDGATSVDPGRTLELVFGADVDPATLLRPGAIRLTRGAVDVGCDWTATGARLEIAPRVALLPGTAYELELTAAVQALDGTPLGPLAIRFGTGAAPVTRGPVFLAGIGVADITPPVGVPLGGYGSRRLATKDFDLDPSNYHLMFPPSQGVRDPIQAKALVLDDGVDRVAIVTLDLIASDGKADATMARKLAQRGVAIDPDAIMTCSSHTHSGPGAISDSLFWAVTALDAFEPSLFDALTDGMADAVEQAVRGLQPARLGVGLGQLDGVSSNRRSGVSPYVQRDTIDRDLGIIRVDALAGYPLATVFNYAIHASAFGPSYDHLSADLAGEAAKNIEAAGGGIALFVNAAEGDIRAAGSAPNDEAQCVDIGRRMADAVIALRARTAADADVELVSASRTFDMGTPALEISQTGSMTPAFVRNFLSSFPVPLNAVSVPLGPQQMARSFRFQAIRLQDTALSSVPGEAIREIGLQIKAEGARLGFAKTLVMGLANGHMSYITTEREYRAGGYEAVATLYGPKTGENVVDRCSSLMQLVKP